MGFIVGRAYPIVQSMAKNGNEKAQNLIDNLESMDQGEVDKIVSALMSGDGKSAPKTSSDGKPQLKGKAKATLTKEKTVVPILPRGGLSKEQMADLENENRPQSFSDVAQGVGQDEDGTSMAKLKKFIGGSENTYDKNKAKGLPSIDEIKGRNQYIDVFAGEEIEQTPLSELTSEDVFAKGGVTVVGEQGIRPMAGYQVSYDKDSEIPLQGATQENVEKAMNMAKEAGLTDFGIWVDNEGDRVVLDPSSTFVMDEEDAFAIGRYANQDAIVDWNNSTEDEMSFINRDQYENFGDGMDFSEVKNEQGKNWKDDLAGGNPTVSEGEKANRQTMSQMGIDNPEQVVEDEEFKVASVSTMLGKEFTDENKKEFDAEYPKGTKITDMITGETYYTMGEGGWQKGMDEGKATVENFKQGDLYNPAEFMGEAEELDEPFGPDTIESVSDDLVSRNPDLGRNNTKLAKAVAEAMGISYEKAREGVDEFYDNSWNEDDRKDKLEAKIEKMMKTDTLDEDDINNLAEEFDLSYNTVLDMYKNRRDAKALKETREGASYRQYVDKVSMTDNPVKDGSVKLNQLASIGVQLDGVNNVSERDAKLITQALGLDKIDLRDADAVKDLMDSLSVGLQKISAKGDYQEFQKALGAYNAVRTLVNRDMASMRNRRPSLPESTPGEQAKPKGKLYQEVVRVMNGNFGPEHFYDLDDGTIGVSPIPGSADYDATLYRTGDGDYALAMFKGGEELNTDDVPYFDTAEEAAEYALDLENYDMLEPIVGYEGV